MIKKISDEIEFQKIKLDSWSFTCAVCDVLIGTCFDFGYNEDYAVDKNRVKESTIICGRCREFI